MPPACCRRSAAFLLSVLSVLAFWSASAAADDRGAAVDRVFAEFTGVPAPGCGVGIAEAGELVHAAGYGYADLEHGVPLTADSVFRVGSLSKQFTAMAVALAATDGLLDLDAPIGVYLPELHPSVQWATVSEVIGHVGGLPDYDSEALNARLTDAMGNAFTFGAEDHLHPDEFFEVTRSVVAIDRPGARWRYSNIGYFWLGRIVERVTGESLHDYAARRIFAPAGMPASQFYDDVRRIVPHRAGGYAPTEDGAFELFETNLDWVGEGGVYTSVNDFAAWHAQFRAPTIGDDPAALRARLLTPRSELASGDNARYAFGLEVGTDDAGRRYVEHGGSWVAFRAFFRRFPEADLGYWILCNRPDVDMAALAGGIETIYLDESGGGSGASGSGGSASK